MENKKRNFLLTAATSSVILILILLTFSSPVVRLALSLALVLLLPGYGITGLLFPGRTLDIPVRLLLSVALSLVTTALIGLILQLTPWGVQIRNPFMILLLGVTSSIGLYFLVRDVLQIDRTTFLTNIGFSFRQVLLLALAAVVVTLAVSVARTPASPKNLTGYTLLGVQPGSSTDRLELEVQSEEFTTTNYQLRFELNDVLHEGPAFELKPGQTWRYSLKLDDNKLTGQPVTLLLYRLDHPNEVYRRVIWWNENN